MHALHYTNELLLRVRLAFQKLWQTRQTSRNYQNRSWLLFSIVRETHKLSRFQLGVKSFLTQLFYTEQTQKFTRTTRADIIRSQREIKDIFDPENAPFH